MNFYSLLLYYRCVAIFFLCYYFLNFCIFCFVLYFGARKKKKTKNEKKKRKALTVILSSNRRFSHINYSIKQITVFNFITLEVVRPFCRCKYWQIRPRIIIVITIFGIFLSVFYFFLFCCALIPFPLLFLFVSIFCFRFSHWIMANR